MQAERPLAWNGMRLVIPACWEPRVAGSCHLVFEKEFLPLLQLRWYKQSNSSSREALGLAAALARQGGETVDPMSASGELAAPWRHLGSLFQVLAFAAGREGIPSGGAFSCPHCHTLFHFQLFPERLDLGKAIAESLTTLSCHDHDDDMWRIQDFSLSLPPGFDLTDYSFSPGLTRLSFKAGQLRLEAARLAPADDRLRSQSLTEILLAQSGVADLQIPKTGDRNVSEGYRNPDMFRRLLLRMRGNRPFVRARISHDPAHNRLLSLILSGSRPLPAGLFPEIADSYAIL